MGRPGLVRIVVIASAMLVVAASGGRAFAPRGLTRLGELVPSGTGEALGPFAVSGGVVFAGAPGATYGVVGQGAVLVFTAPAAGWPGTSHEVAVLQASQPVAGSGVGAWVSAAGSTVVVGSRSGQAYVFAEPVGGWSGVVDEVATLIPAGGSALHDPVISGSTIVAGESGAGGGAGTVDVFDEPAGGWAGQVHASATLTASDATAGAGLGTAVAVSGNTIVAGAPQARVGADTPGAVYVFSEPAGGWSGPVQQTAKLTASDVSTHTGLLPVATEFGSSVAIAGTTIVAGLPITPSAGGPTSTGAVYVFAEPAGGWRSGTESAELVPAAGRLGALQPGAPPLPAISGGTVAVPGFLGGSLAGTPAVYVFTMPAAGWSGTLTSSATLTSSGTDGLDAAVIAGQQVLAGPLDASSDQTIIAAGPVDVFDEPPAGWTGSVGESGRLAGTPPAPLTGDAYLFVPGGAGWSSGPPITTLAPSGNPSSVSFTSAAVTGQTAVAAGDGDADVFAKTLAGWSDPEPVARLADSGGRPLGPVAAGAGTIAAIGGAPSSQGGSRSVDVFTEPPGGWSGTVHDTATLSASDRADLYAVAISDRTVVALGTTSSGTAGYVFTEPAAGWSGTIHEAARLPPPNPSVYARSISVDGATVVINGAVAGSTVVADSDAVVYTEPSGGWVGDVPAAATLTPAWYDPGAVHVYTQPAGGWTGIVHAAARLTFPLPDAFADGLAIHGSTIAIAAYEVPQSRYDYCPCSGGVWLFTEPAGGWNGTITASPSLGTETDYTGSVPLALSGDTVLAGGQRLSQDVADTGLGVFRLGPPIVENTVSAGPPRIRRARLTGLANRRPSLGLDVLAGGGAPPIASLTVTLPRGLAFTRSTQRLVRGLVVGGRPTSGARVLHGQLVVTLEPPLQDVTAAIRTPAVVESAALARAVHKRRRRRGRALTLRTTLLVTDAAGQATRRVITTRVR
jgi:hypothetical protein